MLGLFQFLGILITATISQQKLFKSNYPFTFLRKKQGWIYLDNFRFIQGTAEIQLSIKLNNYGGSRQKNYSMQLKMIPQEEWQREKRLRCSNKLNSNSSNLSILYDINPGNEIKLLSEKFSVNKTFTVYFVLRDCTQTLVNQYFNKDANLQIQLRMTNNGKQIPSDQQFSGYLLFALTLFNFLLLHWVWKKGYMDLQGTQINIMKLCLNVGLLMATLSLCFKALGYLLYMCLTDSQLGIFDFMYLLFHSISQSTMNGLVIFIAYGWTITFVNSMDFEIYIPLYSIFGLADLILTLISKITDGDHDKYHMFDSVSVLILIIFKFIMLVFFFLGCGKTYLYTKQLLIKTFIIKFTIFGTMYIMSTTLLIYLMSFLEAEVRKQAMLISFQLIRNGMNAALVWLLLAQSSSYSKIAQFDKSFMEQNYKLL